MENKKFLRVHELAKKLGVSSKEILEIAKSKNIAIKSVLANVDENFLKVIEDYYKAKAIQKPVSKEVEISEKNALAESQTIPTTKDKQVMEEKPKTIVDETFDRYKVIKPKEANRIAVQPKYYKFKKFPRTEEQRPIRKYPGKIIEKPRKDRRGYIEESIEIKKEPKVEEKEKITVTLPVTLKEISNIFGIKVPILVKKLIEHKIFATINDFLDEDVITLLAIEFNKEVECKQQDDSDNKILQELESEVEEDEKTLLVPRPPVVVVMGHVDHGKTTLLDRIRKTNVASTEAGFITQHIGAYCAELNGKKIIFLDTPGHEAFTSMRARGVNVTDIAVIVIAADDGVMPQTIEAIDHAKAANVPIVIAINKIDKPNANPRRVKLQLSKLNILPEEWGGNTPFIELSALTGEGIERLIDTLHLQAEIMNLKFNPKRKATGIVLESQLSKATGALATLIIRNGTMYKGDLIVCDTVYGKLRNMWDDRGISLDKADCSTPVRVTGFHSLLPVGAKFYVVDNLDLAKRAASIHLERKRRLERAEKKSISLQSISKDIAEKKIKSLKIVLKTDVQGSAEVLKCALTNLSTNEVKVDIVHCGVGSVNESDVLLAYVSHGIILGFNVDIDSRASESMREKGVEVKIYNVIYQLIEEIKNVLSGMLEPEKVENKIGSAYVKALFKLHKIGTVAGCEVKDGKITRDSKIKVYRNSSLIHEGNIESLKRFRDDVKEVTAGFECGIRIAGFDDIQVGDIIEAYEIKFIPRKV